MGAPVVSNQYFSSPYNQTMLDSLQPLFPDEALALLAGQAFCSEPSALSEPYCLLLQYQARLSAADEQELAERLQRLACPSIVIADETDQASVIDAADVRVSNLAEAETLATAVAANPIAATTFVQLLRITENMPLEAALDVESLAYSTLQAGAEYQQWLVANRASEPFKPIDIGPAIIAEHDGGHLLLTLNRASNDNAMSVEMRDALIEALGQVLLNTNVEDVTIKGAGRCFSTGGDLSEFGRAPDPATAHIVRTLSVPGRLLSRCAERVRVEMHGISAGSGIEFPAFAGRIHADMASVFVLPEVSMGLIPGAGGCISIARRIGRQRTAWLGLSGKRIDAQMALAMGLVDSVS